MYGFIIKPVIGCNDGHEPFVQFALKRFPITNAVAHVENYLPEHQIDAVSVIKGGKHQGNLGNPII